MVKVAIIIGSTREGRKGKVVGQWVYEVAKQRSDAEFELVDLKDFRLPLLGEPAREQDDQQDWAATIERFDAYVFVTPEYNHAPPAALKNAIDHLNKEWSDKVAGFVGYGAAGARLAVEQLRQIMTELQVANVRAQVSISLMGDFKNYSVFQPRSYQEKSVNDLFDQVITWGGALKTLRVEPVSLS